MTFEGFNATFHNFTCFTGYLPLGKPGERKKILCHQEKSGKYQEM